MRYKGGVLSATALVTSGSSATGMWTMRQQLQAVGQTLWPSIGPVFPNIGAPYGGGFIGGKINVSGTQYYLIVAPKASGENSSRTWGPSTVTGVFSTINGPTNTATLAALGASYQAAAFCNNLNSGGGLNGYTDWYLPAQNELEVLYYFLKPSTDTNITTTGSNPNAVSPEPVSTNYTSNAPAQTSVVAFKTGGTEAFATYTYTYYWMSNELDGFSGGYALGSGFVDGGQGGFSKSSNLYVRAVRRIPV